jgi:uncharacterized protein YecT (DUF1311 family)
MRTNPCGSIRAAALIGAIALSSPALAADIRVDAEAGRSVISITGPIETGDYDRFLDALDRGQPDLVVLSSPGGNLSEGLAIAAEIALLGLPTFVGEGDGCFSACALIWVSGEPRIMSDGAEIGVHAAYYLVEEIDGALTPTVSSVGNANIGAFLTQLGLDIDAVEFFVAAPPDSIALLTPAAAQVLNIPVLISTVDGSILPSERSPRELVGEAAILTQLGALCTALIDADPNVFEQQAQAALREANAAFGGERVVDLISQEARRIRAQVSDVGPLPWCLSALLSLAEAGRPIGIDGPSHPCARAGTPTEQAICAAPRLWVHDRVLSAVYDARRQTLSPDGAAALLASQRGWLARRDACADDDACLEALYRSRLEDIR